MLAALGERVTPEEPLPPAMRRSLNGLADAGLALD